MTADQFRRVKSPIGELTLIGDGERVEYIAFSQSAIPMRYRVGAKENRSAFPRAVKELEGYFAGRLTSFTFPINLMEKGFRRKALLALAKIKYGETISYADLAKLSGSPNAFRAAGSACAKNPLPIVIPCHRVLKSDGSLGGFGGGLKMKRQLLNLEKAKYKP